MRDESNSAALPLANLWLDLIVGRLLNSASHRRRVWIVVDELPVLGRQAKLETLVTRGRKRGLAAVLGFQSIAQLRRIYGHEQAAVLASMPSTKLLLRVDEPETAAFIARQIGEREALREEIGISTAEHGNRYNIHPARRTEPVVMASEVQRLPKLEGYLCIAGLDRARVKVRLCVPRRRQVEFIPRALPRPVSHEPERRFGDADDQSRPDPSERDRGRPGEDSGLMLVMSKGALTAAQAETYYEEKYSHDDYYSEKQRVVGQWFGRGAEELGLSGEVATEDFRAVLRGLRPASGEVLVHKANGYDDRRAGWDATFNAPKSVSIQGLVGDDHRLIEAHRKAVSRALGELEYYALSRRRGGSEWVVTGNIVAARFDHIAARPASGVKDGYGPDPHLHTHVVIANMTRRPDGQWRGLDPVEIYRAQSFATAVYRSELAREVQQLGYEIRIAGRDGRWELDGYSREQVMAFSRRRQDIEQTLAREGLAGAEAAQNIAHRTRLSKDHRDEESLKAEWRSRALQYGIEVERHLSQSRERGPIQFRHPEKAGEAIRQSIDENSEREAVIDRRALEAKALQHAMGSVELHQIRTLRASDSSKSAG